MIKYQAIKISLEKKGFEELVGLWSLKGQSWCYVSITELKKMEKYPYLSKEISHTLGLDREQFDKLIECPLSKETYANIINMRINTNKLKDN